MIFIELSMYKEIVTGQ